MEDHTRLLVIDGTNLYWRAYHGLVQQALAKGDQPTFAVYGMVNTIANVFKQHHPTHAVIVFDWGKSAYRLAIWPKYKAGRPTSEVVDYPDAEDQMTICQDLLPMFGLKTWRVFEVEADDLIASAVVKFKTKVNEVMVITGDKDMRQLAGDNVCVVHPALGNRAESVYTSDRVLKEYGVTPDRLPEVWALSGDKIDNIPGVPGIGEKTAIKFIQKYGDLSHVALSSEKKLDGYRHDINMSFRLVSLSPGLAEFPGELDAIRFLPTTSRDKIAKELSASLTSLGFESLVSRWKDGTLWKDRGVRLKDMKSQQH